MPGRRPLGRECRGESPRGPQAIRRPHRPRVGANASPSPGLVVPRGDRVARPSPPPRAGTRRTPESPAGPRRHAPAQPRPRPRRAPARRRRRDRGGSATRAAALDCAKVHAGALRRPLPTRRGRPSPAAGEQVVDRALASRASAESAQQIAHLLGCERPSLPAPVWWSGHESDFDRNDGGRGLPVSEDEDTPPSMLGLADERREMGLRLGQGGALHETNMTRMTALAQAEPDQADAMLRSVAVMRCRRA